MDKKKRKLSSDKYEEDLREKDEEITRLNERLTDLQHEMDLRKKDEEIDQLSERLTHLKHEMDLRKKDEEIARLSERLTHLKSETESALLLQHEKDLRKMDEEIARLSERLTNLKEKYEEDLRKKDEEIARLNECLTNLKQPGNYGPFSACHPPIAGPSSVSQNNRGLHRMSVEESNDVGVNINSLPDELIVKIFKSLTQNKLARIARVCKRWHRLSRCPLLWKKVDVSFDGSHKSQNKVVALFCESIPDCTSHIRLDFQYRPWEDYLNFEPFCQRLGTQCPSIKTLVLRRTRFSVSVQSVIGLCTHYFQNLEILGIQFPEFSDCSVEGEYGDCSKIKVHSDPLHLQSTRFQRLLAVRNV